MDGDELRTIRKSAHLTAAQAAAILGVSATTVYRWEWGHQAVPEMVAKCAPILLQTKPK